MQVNEHIIKLTGKASIEKALILGQDYTFEGTGNVVKIEESDNQDGTVNLTYTLKPIIVTSVGEQETKEGYGDLLKDY